jgi:hypothetical protein
MVWKLLLHSSQAQLQAFLQAFQECVPRLLQMGAQQWLPLMAANLQH